MAKKLRVVILIANPEPGGAEYTSPRSAQRAVDRGIAEWHSARQIRFIRRERVTDSKSRERESASIVRSRGGIIPWNGADNRPNAFHRPFENVQIPRPDRKAYKRAHLLIDITPTNEAPYGRGPVALTPGSGSRGGVQTSAKSRVLPGVHSASGNLIARSRVWLHFYRGFHGELWDSV